MLDLVAAELSQHHLRVLSVIEHSLTWETLVSPPLLYSLLLVTSTDLKAIAAMVCKLQVPSSGMQSAG